MRYSVRLSYNGSFFCGWQIQKSSPSIQEELQKALAILLKKETTVTGAGRTDTGVNAVNYIAHFDSGETALPDPAGLAYKLNAIVPKGIVIHEIREENPDFHARFSATSRRYRYFLHRKKDPFSENFSYLCRYPLDVRSMNRAAAFLIGKHDFSCFEKTGGNNLSSICTVYEARWESYTPSHVGLAGYPAEEGDYLVFTVRADRFLRNMVRAIVGSLLEVGKGKKDPQWIERLIESGKRSDAGESVPGKALFLDLVSYPGSVL